MSQLLYDFINNNNSLHQIFELLPNDTEISFYLDNRIKFTLQKTDQGIEIFEKESFVADLEIGIATESLRLLNELNDGNIKEFLNAVFKELLAGGIQVRLLKHYSQLMAKGYLKTFELITTYIKIFMGSEGYQNFMKLVDLAKRLKNKNYDS